MYEVPCLSCNSKYIGETGRLLKTRLDEHKKDTENIPKEAYTRSNRRESERTYQKSAITEHMMRENHVIDWAKAKAIDKERVYKARIIREAIWIRRTPNTMNRDEGAYQLARAYDTLTTTPSSGQVLQTSV